MGAWWVVDGCMVGGRWVHGGWRMGAWWVVGEWRCGDSDVEKVAVKSSGFMVVQVDQCQVSK